MARARPAGRVAGGRRVCVRARAAARVAGAVAANPVSRSAVLGPMRARPWRVPAADGAAEIRALGRSPGFAATLRRTLGAQPAIGLDAVAVPARVCFGTRDVLLGAYTAPRFACAVPRAELHRLPACGHVPMADDPGAVAAAVTGLTGR